MEGSYYLEHKEKFREYGVKYYNSNKHEVNKRRLLRRIAAGAPIRKNTLEKYNIDFSLVDSDKILV
jgi:hypothetical protein